MCCHPCKGAGPVYYVNGNHKWGAISALDATRKNFTSRRGVDII